MVVATATRRRQSVRVERRLAARRAARRRWWALGGGAVVVAAVAIGILALGGGDGGDGVSRLPAVVAARAEMPAGVVADGRALGDPDAPVTVIEYGDYQCPGCGFVALDVQPQLVADFVATGKVRFEYRDYAFIGEESVAAAEAAACAVDQGAFWPFHDTLFINQHGERQGAFAPERLRQAAAAVGLDSDRFNTCLADRTHRDAVAGMVAEARALGISGTPAFVVNGALVEWRGYDELRAAIEAALAG